MTDAWHEFAELNLQYLPSRNQRSATYASTAASSEEPPKKEP
jgi:hypothetical protein